MKKFFYIILALCFVCLQSVAHTALSIKDLDFPAIVKAAQQLPDTGTLQIYQRQHESHEGNKNSLYLYLSVSPDYAKKIYPLIENALKQQFPNIKPTKNSLGPHVSLLRDAPKQAKTYVGKQFNFQITGIQLITEIKNVDTPDEYHHYFVSLTVDSPEITDLVKSIAPQLKHVYLHISVAEWSE